MCKFNPLLALLLLIACLPLHAQPDDLPPGPMQAKMKTSCLECHDSGIIVQQRLGKAAWTKEVDKMIKWGAVVNPSERDSFIEYLSTNFPVDKDWYRPPTTARRRKK